MARLQQYQYVGWNGRFAILSADQRLFYGDVLIGYALEVIISCDCISGVDMIIHLCRFHLELLLTLIRL